MKKSFKKRYFFYIILVVLILFVKGAVYSDISFEELKKEYANKDYKFIEIDEMQVHYRDEGQGFPIVLIHGTGSSLHTWNDWTEDLKNHSPEFFFFHCQCHKEKKGSLFTRLQIGNCDHKEIQKVFKKVKNIIDL